MNSLLGFFSSLIRKISKIHILMSHMSPVLAGLLRLLFSLKVSSQRRAVRLTVQSGRCQKREDGDCHREGGKVDKVCSLLFFSSLSRSFRHALKSGHFLKLSLPALKSNVQKMSKSDTVWQYSECLNDVSNTQRQTEKEYENLRMKKFLCMKNFRRRLRARGGWERSDVSGYNGFVVSFRHSPAALFMCHQGWETNQKCMEIKMYKL